MLKCGVNWDILNELDFNQISRPIYKEIQQCLFGKLDKKYQNYVSTGFEVYLNQTELDLNYVWMSFK